jgi:hypothetical protein
MHYVKHFNINNVDTKQVACIELHGKPNAATEGAVGVLGVDVNSPLHEVYKCVAVQGSIYTWELLSSGMSIISATTSEGGKRSAEFLYSDLRTPPMYVVKIGDLIVDKEGYLYYIYAFGANYCAASYCDAQSLRGHTPVKGTDYWTPEDVNEIKEYVDAVVKGYNPTTVYSGDVEPTSNIGSDGDIYLVTEE